MNDPKIVFRSAESVLRPKSVAIVGASERGRWPRDIFNSLRTHGYPGRVYLINPRQREVYGEKAYPSLRELPEAVDHAVVIIPAPGVQSVLSDADVRGLKSATIYAGGVGDGENPDSIARGAWVRDFLKTSKMRIAGPNCMGGFSFRERMFAYPNQEIAKLEPGHVGVVFQSGGSLQFFLKTGASRGLRYSYGISSGNEIDLDLADYLNFLVDDPHTRQIALFIEGIRRPDAFMHAAGRALQAGKPIMTIKTGATAKSASAAASHTGAIAGDYAGYEAMCERYGIINCPSLDDLLETTLAFQTGCKPKGPKIGFVTTSGGTVDLLYDYVEYENSILSQFSDATNEASLPFMQDEIKPKNPLDVGIPSTMKAAADLCEIVGMDPDVDILAWASQLPAKKTALPDWMLVSEMAKRIGKPVIGFSRMSYPVTDESIEMQAALGIPFLQELQPALRAMNAIWFHASREGKYPEAPPPAPPSDLRPETLDATLARYGVFGPKSRIVTNAQAAAKAAVDIGFPVVLKVQSRDILHKTEAGGVVLDLRTGDAVISAVDELVAGARAAYPDARIDGFLVQEMVSGVEAIVGARSDALYGPTLLVGSGGILVELLDDVSLTMLPIAENGIGPLVNRLKLAKLLAGYRGKPAADRAAFEKTAAALGQFYLDHRSMIADIEINPLIVRPNGKGVVAVDVRVIWKGQEPAAH